MLRRVMRSGGWLLLGWLAVVLLVFMIYKPSSGPAARPPANHIEVSFEGTVVYFYESHLSGQQVVAGPVQSMLNHTYPDLRLLRMEWSGSEEDLMRSGSLADDDRPILIVTSNPEGWAEQLDFAEWSLTDLSVPLVRGYEGDAGMYGVYAFYVPYVLYYNKDLFDLAGVPYPERQLDWEEVHRLAQLMTRTVGEKSIYGFYMNLSFSCESFVNRFEDRLSSSSVMLSDGWKACYENAARIYAIPGNSLSEGQLARGVQSFLDGVTAMYLGPLIPELHRSGQGLNWGMSAYPTMGDLGAPATDKVVMIPGTPGAGEAAKLAAALVSPEVQLRHASARRDAMFMETLFHAMEQAGEDWADMSRQSPGSVVQAAREMENLRIRYLGHAARGTMDVNTALRTAEEEIWLYILRLKDQ